MRAHTILIHDMIFGNPKKLGGLFCSDLGTAFGAELVGIALPVLLANETSP